MKEHLKNIIVSVDRIDIPCKEVEILDANIIQVAVGTTGYKGGDTGHGGRTFFGIRNESGTDMRLTFVASKWPSQGGQLETEEADGHTDVYGCNLEAQRICIEFGGDAELSTFIEALEFAVETLKEQTK